MRPVIWSWWTRQNNGADQENSILNHCPENSLVNAQIFTYKVLSNAHVDRGDDLVQAFAGVAALWFKLCSLNTVHYHWPGDVWVRLPCIKVLTGLHTQQHSLPECKPEIWQPIFSQGTRHMCNRPLSLCPGHNQDNNLSEMYHYQ